MKKLNITRPQSDQPMPPHAKKVFSGILNDVYQWEQKQFDGTYKTFEKIKRKDTVTIIPVTDDGKLILTKQEQPGVKAFVGFPGGVLETDEDPLEAAKRELLEETGYEAKEFILWDAVQLLRQTEWAMYTFIAKGCRKVSDLKLDSGEKIQVQFITFDELLYVIVQKNFRDLDIALKIFRAKESEDEFEKLKELFLVK